MKTKKIPVPKILLKFFESGLAVLNINLKINIKLEYRNG